MFQAPKERFLHVLWCMVRQAVSWWKLFLAGPQQEPLAAASWEQGEEFNAMSKPAQRDWGGHPALLSPNTQHGQFSAEEAETIAFEYISKLI